MTIPMWVKLPFAENCGKYKLNDPACAELLSRLSNQHMAGVDNDLKTQLLAFYATTGYNEPVRKREMSAQKIQQEIEELKGEVSGPLPAAKSLAGATSQ